MKVWESSLMAADGMSGSPPFERVEEKNGAYWSPEG